MQLRVPLTVFFPHAAGEPVHKNGCGPFPLKGWRPMV